MKRSAIAGFLLHSIHVYQASRVPGRQRCIHEPTCSCYAAQAIEKHGALKGGWLSLRRIGRCRPGQPGGLDPVP